MTAIATATNALLRVMLTPECAACAAPLARPLESPVCQACWASVRPVPAPACVRCGEPLAADAGSGPACRRCTTHPPAFMMARSVGPYEGALREIVHVYKFGRRRALAQPLAGLMRRAGLDLLAGADAVVPVPLHPWRAFQRGFNQADDLASGLGLPVWRVLRRHRGGLPQSALPAGRRHANVAGAFALSRRMAGPGAPRLRNTVVVLVDDVMTTGATLDACGRALGAAGVRRVTALTLARTAPARRPAPARPPRPSTAPRR